MKTIILATDFSENARRAARFAAKLALDQKARLMLLHAFHVWPDNPAKTGDFPLSVQAIKENCEHRLGHLAHQLKASLGAELSVTCIAREGYPMPVIRQETKALKADLLVMSTVGDAPQSAQLLGSIATSMVGETNVPLLLIPPLAGYGGIKNIVLGIDLATPLNALSLETALSFARAFGSVINVLCVTNKPDDPAYKTTTEQIRRLLVPQPHTLSILEGNEVYEALLSFSHKNKADLIMMMPQNRSWIRKIFGSGETQRVARLTDLPLLAIV